MEGMIIGQKPKRRSSAVPMITSLIAAAPIIIPCPCCGLHIKFNNHHQGFPAGVKFDPTDQQLLEHLEAKVHHKLNTSLIDNFIPTVDEEVHPHNLPGISENGKIGHFFHRILKPHSTGESKRRKVNAGNNEDRWIEIGEAKPIFIGDKLKGFKRMLVLYSNYGKQNELEKTNWVRHQYHLIGSSNEEDGKLVVSKVLNVQMQPM